MTHHDHGSGTDHFDEASKTWDDDPAKLERARTTAALLRKRLPLTGSERVLEIGGGTGQLSLNLADAVGSVTVSDVSPGMVQAAAVNIRAAGLADRFTAIQLDLARESAPGAPFDGAWSQLTWHHVSDAEQLLRRTREALVPGGWLAVVELDTDAAGDFHAHHAEFTGHHGFDRDTFAGQMRTAGFRDVTVEDAGSVERELEARGRQLFTMFLAIGYAAGQS
ncbi:class I SAM-dependent methyltransferase [Nakamurella lactea]|uniref:class I SAM-dependent methyltransferase n=1 Tax=Nakamurella lactea TaxID=459515 RepID=UPI0003FFF612|nr:class I SAM-dependent methyltransferase [Nakamurella lactea]